MTILEAHVPAANRRILHRQLSRELARPPVERFGTISFSSFSTSPAPGHPDDDPDIRPEHNPTY